MDRGRQRRHDYESTVEPKSSNSDKRTVNFCACRRASLLVLGLVMSAVVLASCANQVDTSKVTKSPGLIAVSYVRDIFSGHVTQAEELVAPSQRKIFREFASQIKPGLVSATHVGVGSVRIVNKTAFVILTGRLCSGTTNPPGSHCMSNSNRRSNNPAFEVKLARSSNGTYFVIYQPESF